MARSTIQRRHDAERERIETYTATLRGASGSTRAARNLRQALDEAQVAFAEYVIRDPAAWQPRLKTRDEARLRLAAARHLFARYPVPPPLERIWLGTAGLGSAEVAERKRWYIVVAQGGSLYKTYARDWLSRKEVHAFLNPPVDLSLDEALWQAVARSSTDDLGIALRVARSKIARMPRADFAFWREAARFFSVHPAPIEMIDDLCDFLVARRRQDPDYSLKGRTPASLARQMQEWHRELALIRRIGNGHWDGSPMVDWFWTPAGEGAPFEGSDLIMVQLKTSAELVAEGRAMHHCVATYARACLAGNSSIWSLRSRTARGIERLLTIELDQQHKAVQVRGFGNRTARPDELRVVRRWARDCGVVLTR